MHLTKTVLDKATYQGSAGKRLILWDDDVPGFGLRVYPSGEKTFVVLYRIGRRQRFLTVGKHGVLSLQQARDKAKKLLVQVMDGSDPADEREHTRRAPTFEELAARYLAEHAEKKKKPLSIRSDRCLLDRHLKPVFGKRLAESLTFDDISRFHAGMSSTPIQANRALAVLSKMLNLAERWGVRPMNSNPCRYVERYKERKCERFLSREELGQLGRVLAEAEASQSEHSSALLAIRLLLLTGARKGEILTLRWAEVDFDRSCLRLPDSKTGKKMIPLGAPALALLRKAPRLLGNPYVCHGEEEGGYFIGLHRPWDRLRKLAGLPEVRLHDLRHTHASVAAGAGIGLPIIGRLLGHSSPATTARYAHLADDPLKAAAHSVTQSLCEALAG